MVGSSWFRAGLSRLSVLTLPYGSADRPFASAELSAAELETLTTTAGFIQVNGGGFGICGSCRAGANEAGQ